MYHGVVLQSIHGPSEPQENYGSGISPTSWASQGGLFCVLFGPAANEERYYQLVTPKHSPDFACPSPCT